LPIHIEAELPVAELVDPAQVRVERSLVLRLVARAADGNDAAVAIDARRPRVAERTAHVRPGLAAADREREIERVVLLRPPAHAGTGEQTGPDAGCIRDRDVRR